MVYLQIDDFASLDTSVTVGGVGGYTRKLTNATVDTALREVTISNGSSGSVKWSTNGEAGSASFTGTTAIKLDVIYAIGSVVDVSLTVNTTTITSGTSDGSVVSWDITSVPDLDEIKLIEIKPNTGEYGRFIFGAGGADPHMVCFDNSRLEVYHNGIYRLFEDHAADVFINMRIDNTFITDIFVGDSVGGSALVCYNVDNNRQLHANFLALDVKTSSTKEELVATRGDESLMKVGDTDAEEIVISCGGGYKIRTEAKYRSFGIENDALMTSGHKMLRSGGAMSTVVHEVTTIDDVTPGPVLDIELGKWDAHALACDAHFPHVVSFYGAQTIPGYSDNHLLFEHHESDLSVHASMDHFSRLDILRVVIGGHDVLRASWSRPTSTIAPSVDSVPLTTLAIESEDSLCVDGADSNTFFATHGKSATDATRFFERTFALSGGGELLVRAQANGATSFALRGARSFEDEFSGLLVERGTGSPCVKGSASAKTSSVYERKVEPHLAWSQGRGVVDKATMGRISAQ